jgi:hypothetical protein
MDDWSMDAGVKVPRAGVTNVVKFVATIPSAGKGTRIKFTN